MIKVILIFLLYLQLTNAEGELDYPHPDFKNSCKETGGELFGWPRNTICIPRKFQRGLQNPPKQPHTEVNFTLHQIQVIEIDSNSITITLIPHINWTEHRLELMKGFQSIYLNEVDQKRIWSHHLFVNHMISFDVKHEKYLLSKNEAIGNVLVVDHSFWAMIKVKCKMNFLEFPFDEHLCIIKVKLNFLQVFNLPLFHN